jgi:hypothetical protein
MKHVLSAALGLALCAAPAATQISGSINRGAPVLEKSISFEGGDKLSLSYTAIHFGQGQWQGLLDAKDQHERFNQGAMRRPIGSVETSTTVYASGREIPAGKYDMFFSLHADAGWLLNLKSKDNADADPIRWRLVMSDSTESCKRMQFNLNAGDAKDEASLTIAFGKKKVTVPVSTKKPAPPKDEKKSGN